MQVVILCGGKGRRIRQGGGGVPKGLIRIGAMPILWHIMKYYAHFGFNDFVLATGYKAKQVEQFFRREKELRIRCVDTGVSANTGERIKLIEPYIHTDSFFATYGDGLGAIDLRALARFHRAHKKVATLTAVPYRSVFGVLEINAADSTVTSFEEKPKLDYWINGGFFAFSREVFDYLRKGDILEKHTFLRLLKARQLYAFKYRGFWKCMDTYKDELELNALWLQGKAKWRVW